jgi:predicted SprT family Zn-dependent metalloprotease
MRGEYTEAECEVYANHIIKKYLKLPWQFEWSNKMSSAFGYCYATKIIRLSRKYFNLNKSFPTIVRNVILHEVAHAIQLEKMGYLSHDKHWKKYCLDIGAIPKARFSSKDVTIPCKAFAIRNTLNGNVPIYFKPTKPTLRESLDEVVDMLDKAGKTGFEVVWCGD